MKALVRFVTFLSVFLLCFTTTTSHPGVAWSAPKGKLIIAQGGEIITLDPHMQEQVFAHNVCTNIFNTLVQRVFENGRLTHKPMLATSWKAIDDTTWIFHLRRGVKFHNGEDFNAEVVKYNIERVLNPAQKARKRYAFTSIEKIDILDPYTIRITTKTPLATLIVNLGFSLYIVPPKYVKEKGDAYVSTHPVGTGPFKFVRWVKDDQLVLEANEDYWSGPPNIKTLVFKPIPEDSTRVAALVAGDVDIATNVPTHLIHMVDKSRTARVATAPSALAINVHLDNLTAGPIQDRRVRQALNYAVNKRDIINYVLEGYGKPLGSPLTPAHFGYNPAVKPYPYDPEKAKALLKEAGYGDGLTLTFNSPSGRYVKDKEIAEAIAGQLGKVGVTVNVVVHEWGSYMKKLYSPEGAGPMYTIGWAGNLDADGVLFPTLHCGMRFSRWCNKEFDSYLDKAQATVDQKEREKLYHQALKFCHEEAPWIFLHHGVDAYGVSNRVQNWKPTADVNRTLYMHQSSGSFPSVKD